MASPCRLQSGELIAYQDGTLPVGRREIVEAHLAACDHCQERLSAFCDTDRIIQENALTTELPEQSRAALRTKLQQEADSRAGWSRHQSLISLPQSLVARLLVALLVLLVTLPPAAQAGFPLGHFVHFAEVEIKELLPLDAQEPIRHVAPSDSSISAPSFDTVAPAALPLGLVRVEQSVPDPERLELLYRNQTGVVILVTQLPAADGMVTLEEAGTERAFVGGTDVLIVTDPRPGTVAALFWERDGVFFDVLVTEAPPGAYGGLKRADALTIIEGLMDAQDNPGT